MTYDKSKLYYVASHEMIFKSYVGKKDLPV